MAKHIAVVLTPGFADWEAAYILGCGVGFYGLEATLVAEDHAEIVSQGGMRVRPTSTVEDLRPEAYDGVVLPGGTGWMNHQIPGLADVLQGFLQRGKLVAGICGGTLGLARAGMLDHVPHTSNSVGFLQEYASGYLGQHCYRVTPRAVRSGSLVTAPGTAPVSFTAEIFRALDLLDEAKIAEFEAMTAAEHRNDEPAA